MTEGHIALIISGILLLLTLYKEISNSSRLKVGDTKEEDSWKSKIETKLGIMEYRIGDLSDRLGKFSAAGLHQPHPEHKLMDSLIEKYVNGDDLSDMELSIFVNKLRDIENDGNFLDRERAKNVLRAIEEKYQIHV